VLTAAVLLAVLVGTLAQWTSGLGFSLVCGPLLVAALGPQDGVRLAVALSLLLNLVLLARLHRQVQWRPTLLLLVPGLLATPLLAVGVRRLPERPAAALVGAVVLLGVGLLASGLRWPAARGTAGAVVAGVAAAGTNLVASVAGPPVALWAANADWEPVAQRASLQALFLGLNVVALPALGLPDVPGAVLAGCLAAMVVGGLLGARLARRLSDRAARRAVLGLAGAGGAAVLVQAL
jgi:uncharacterized protein